MLELAATIVVLSVLITVHELGHFLAAKSVGIQVPRFSLGLGKKVWGFRWGETEFVLSAIPLGGYVKMAGMEDDEAQSTLEGGAEGEPVDPERTFDSKPLWARAWVISAGVIMNFLFAFLMYTVVALAYGDRDVAGTRVSPIPAAPDAPAAVRAGAAEAAKIPDGAEIRSIGGTAVATQNELTRALARAGAGPTAVVLGDGRTVTLDVPSEDAARVALLNALDRYNPPVLATIAPGGPLARAGFQAGDRVLAVDGTPVASFAALTLRVRASAERPLAFTVLRGADTVRATVTPVRVREGGESFGQMGATSLAAEVQFRRIGPVEAVTVGARATWETTKEIVVTLKQLLTGELSPTNLGGLLTIGEASGQSARMGLPTYLLFLALFSVNLAVLNLLPIPILDGGHLLFLTIEGIRGRPLSVETRIRLSHVGLIVVIGLMLWANGNDVVRWIGRLMGG